TPAELDKARRQFLSHQFHSLTSMRGKASSLGSNWLHARDLNFNQTYLVAGQYFADGNLTVSSLMPKGTGRKRAASTAARRAGTVEKFTLSNGLRLLV